MGGFAKSENYVWNRHLLQSKSFGDTYPNSLMWTYSYNDKDMVESITDENGLKKRFVYDGLMRLNTVYDRTKPDGTEAEATITYDYHYQNGANDYNYVGTSTTFRGITTPPLSTKQYLDGLGRPIEVVKEGYTPSGQHQKNYVAYDALGRQNKAFLPFESSSLGFQAASTSALVHPFALTEYEASPLSRPIKQTNVDGTTVLSSYGVNNATDVRFITNIAAANTTFYAANTLSKTAMTDENGKITCIFKINWVVCC